MLERVEQMRQSGASDDEIADSVLWAAWGQMEAGCDEDPYPYLLMTAGTLVGECDLDEDAVQGVLEDVCASNFLGPFEVA